MLKKLLKWSVPVLLLLFGAYLWLFVSGHHFLGVLLCGIAAVITCFYLLFSLKETHPKTTGVMIPLLTAILILGSILYGITLVPILQASRPPTEPAPEYIIVLGARVIGEAPSASLQDRIDTAFEYLSEHPHVIAIVSGGQGPDEEISEALCMYNTLTKMGISPNRIWIEDRSTSTRENLSYSLTLIEEKTNCRPVKIGLVSSAYHIYRASLVAEDCGVQALGLPAPTHQLTLKLNYYLREVAALWYYLLF